MRKFTEKLGTKSKNYFKKKRNFCEINQKQKINKPKELWKTLKSTG